MNPLQNPASIPTPMPLPSPLSGMPFVPQMVPATTFHGGGLPVPQAAEQSDFPKKKVISIAIAGILVIAGVAGIMYAFGVFSENMPTSLGNGLTNE